MLEKISCTLSCFAAFSRARLAQAVPTYLAIVRRLVFDHLEREGVDVAKLAAAWQRIAQAT
ncbi:hypothetical protein RFN57_03675 [Streptomyces violaceochromogenes]|uniref:Uncharacterized protein n=1 Tax=Streptomyces violaceochromogenes TaxID=67377 RepID=A0ABU6LPJ2_9ACTN|nr:hypothetical protein [Streptomyces violaceochromogenes]MEC7051403.1 hypothetical protein [Streptomyces violaceochromogenes]